MNKNNERSSRAAQTAEWNLKSPQLIAPSHPYWWIAVLLLINLLIWSWGLSIFAMVGLLISLWIGANRLQRHRRYQRQQWIEQYSFPDQLWQRVEHPLSAKEKRLIERGLKDFFLIYSMTHQKIAMPSQAVDVLWHALILDTQAYHAFCQQAFGKMLHHIPSERMLEERVDDAALCLAWQGACRLDTMDPHSSTQLPRLFAIDAWLGWPSAVAYDTKDLTARYRHWRATQPSGHAEISDGDADTSGCGGGCGGGD
jgi:hypothetical protein